MEKRDGHVVFFNPLGESDVHPSYLVDELHRATDLDARRRLYTLYLASITDCPTTHTPVDRVWYSLPHHAHSSLYHYICIFVYVCFIMFFYTIVLIELYTVLYAFVTFNKKID